MTTLFDIFRESRGENWIENEVCIQKSMAAMGLSGARFVSGLAIFFCLDLISGTILQWKDPNLL